MKYNFKRAVSLSLLLYVATFIVGIISGIVSGQDMSTMQGMPDSFWYVGMVAAVILTAGFTQQYFKSPKIQASRMTGAYFGVTAVVVSFVIDFILFSIGNAGGANVDLREYYGDWRFWIIVILVIGTAKFVGWRKGGK